MHRDVLPRPALLVVLAGLLAGLGGCAGPVEVTRTFTPTAASRVDAAKLRPVAVIREDVSFAVPAGSRVEADQIVRRDGQTLALQPTDAVVMRGLLAPDESIPGGGRVESSRRTSALATGLIVLGVSYGPTAYIGGSSAGLNDRVLLVPLAGPWIDLARRPACVTPQNVAAMPIDPCAFETATRAALVASGALQGFGALLTLVGLPTQARVIDGDRGVAIVPAPGGAGVLGRF
jgi:hypothetical protein